MFLSFVYGQWRLTGGPLLLARLDPVLPPQVGWFVRSELPRDLNMKIVDSRPRRLPEFNPGRDSAVQTGIFSLTGENWTIEYGGVSCSLRNVLGLSYVQRLLQHPGEEFHALDLLRGPGIEAVQEGERPDEAALRNTEDYVPRRPSDLGAMLDTRAKQDYRRRLDELREELEDLRDRGASERAEKVESEIEFIKRELARALGLGGRDRHTGSAAERARINVTRAIRAAIQRVSEHHGSLGKLLDESIRTGSFCRYVPSPKVAINWRFGSDVAQASAEASAPVAPPAPAVLLLAAEPGLPQLAQDQTAFVGRVAERTAMRGYLQRALNGEGGMVMITGPPGIGKTRLSRETGADARRLGFVTLAGNSYDREDSVPFIPIVEILEVAMAQSPTPRSFREFLGDEAAEITRLMPQLRQLFPDIPPPLQVSPEQARRGLFNAIVELIARLSRITPLLLLVEDVHWAEEGTLALLTHLARAIKNLPVLLMLTYRDDEVDPAGPLSKTLDELIRLRVEQIRLLGLPQTAVAEMIEALSGHEPPPALVNLICTNTEGNPLFVEELFRHLERSGSNGAVLEVFDQTELDLPHSLRLVIGRRLMRVSKETQKILGMAAVIGRSFTFALLEAATNEEADRLVGLVEEAEKAGLITSRLRYPDAQFRFGHELIRRAVLDNLSIPRRQRLHLSVAEAIELLYSNTVEDHAEDLAHHLWNAGAAAETNKTIRYLQIAGAKAVQTAANVEAIGHFRKALQLVNSTPDSPERAQTELMLQVTLVAPLFTTKGYGSPEVEAVFARARYLCRQAGEAPQLFPVLWGIWQFHTARAEHTTARDLAGECLRLAEKAGDPALLLAAHHALGVSLSTLADFEPALEHQEQTIKLYDQDRHAVLAFQFGQDFGVVARSHAALDLCYLGYPERALTMTDEALDRARKLSHPHSLAAALVFAARVHRMCRDPRATQQRAEEALKLSAEGDFGFWQPVARIFRGWALAQGSGIEEGITEIREGLSAYRASGGGVGRPTFLALFADAYGRAGQPAEGLDALSEAYATVKQSGERWSEPELYQLEGELTLKLSGTQRPQSSHQKRAEDCFLRAREIAHDQKGKLAELRAAVSLHRLWTTGGQATEARRLLEEIYGWFTEGFDSPDLIEAAQLIESET
jgi:predicted ATPase